MSDILSELCSIRRRDAEERALSVPFEEMVRRAALARPARGFSQAFAADGINVIAELKKASPSAGMIREDFPHMELAAELEAAGAAAISVLVEPHRFLGSERYLEDVSRIVSIPVLYKDFVTTRYQVAAARAAGADAVLLIAAALDDAALADLIGFVHELGFEALVETHDEMEIERSLVAGARVVGVNCRNLRDFSMDLGRISRMIGSVRRPAIRIAESGMLDYDAILGARVAGADGFLVGTALMRAQRPGEKLREMMGVGR